MKTINGCDSGESCNYAGAEGAKHINMCQSLRQKDREKRKGPGTLSDVFCEIGFM